MMRRLPVLYSPHGRAVIIAAGWAELFGRGARPVGDRVALVLINHRATHLGQIAMRRRAGGLPAVFG